MVVLSICWHWLQKFKEAGGTVREIDVASRVIMIISALVICIIVCLSWAATITVITPLPTKPSATKMPENWSWRTRHIDVQMRQRDVAALDAKYTKELADAKAEKWCSAWWCCRWSSSVAHQQSVSQCVKLPPPPAWIMQPPPDWQTDTAERDYFTLRERLITMQKNNWKEPRSILMSRRVAHIDGQLMQLLWAIHTRFQRSINA